MKPLQPLGAQITNLSFSLLSVLLTRPAHNCLVFSLFQHIYSRANAALSVRASKCESTLFIPELNEQP